MTPVVCCGTENLSHPLSFYRSRKVNNNILVFCFYMPYRLQVSYLHRTASSTIGGWSRWKPLIVVLLVILIFWYLDLKDANFFCTRSLLSDHFHYLSVLLCCVGCKSVLSAHISLAGQLMFIMRSACHQSFQLCSQRLMLAMYSCEIQAPVEVLGENYNIIDTDVCIRVGVGGFK